MEAQVLLPGQVAVQRGVLEHQADVAAHGVPLPHHVVPGNPGGPRGGVRQGAQDLDRGGLASAVRAKEAESLPRGHLEVDAAHGVDLAVLLDQLADRDRRSHPCVSSPASSSSDARIRYSALRVSTRILLPPGSRPASLPGIRGARPARPCPSRRRSPWPLRPGRPGPGPGRGTVWPARPHAAPGASGTGPRCPVTRCGPGRSWSRVRRPGPGSGQAAAVQPCARGRADPAAGGRRG